MRKADPDLLISSPCRETSDFFVVRGDASIRERSEQKQTRREHRQSVEFDPNRPFSERPFATSPKRSGSVGGQRSSIAAPLVCASRGLRPRIKAWALAKALAAS